MIVIDKWSGLVTNASPYALPVGAAATQVNLQILSPGRVTVRPGDTAVSWGTHTGSTAPVVVAMRFQHGSSENIVYQDSAGGVYVARNPS